MSVLNGVVPAFLIIGLGVLARRRRWVDEPFVRQLNRVIYLLAIPALLLRLLGRVELGATFSLELVAACSAATLVVAGVAVVVARWRREPPERRGVFVQGAVRGNLAYMAFPVIFAAAGEHALSIAAVTAAVLIPLQNLVGVGALVAAGDSRGKEFLRLLLLNPVVLGVAGGLLWAVSGWHAWAWLDTFLRLLGSLAMPGALLTVGAQLRLEGVRGHARSAGFASVLKLAAVPALGLLLLTWLGVTGTARLVGVLLLAAPTAVASTAVAQELGGDLEFAGSIVVLSSLGSFAGFVLWGLLG